MDVNKENRKKESTTDWILNLDFNPEGVIHPFMFQMQHERRNLCWQRNSGKRVSRKMSNCSNAHVLKITSVALVANVKSVDPNVCGKRMLPRIKCTRLSQQLNLKGRVFFFSIHTSSRVRVLSLKKTVVPAMDSFHIANWMKWIIFQFQEPSSGVLMSKSHLVPQTAPVGMQLSWK